MTPERQLEMRTLEVAGLQRRANELEAALAKAEQTIRNLERESSRLNAQLVEAASAGFVAKYAYE